MSLKIEVKSPNAALKAQREAAARRVIGYFYLFLPQSRLLCFLDDKDPCMLRDELGPENRGLYGPIHDNTRMNGWPEDVTSRIYVYDDVAHISVRVIDDLIYLYGSTCDDEVGLTMTLAHEIQHAVQHSTVRLLWAANSLALKLCPKVKGDLKLEWSDIPTEVEARIVSKRVAECLFGERRVREYIDKKIAEHISDDDVADWNFILTLLPSSSVDLAGDTQRLFLKLQGYRPELDAILREEKDKGNPDFNEIDLNAFFVPPRTAE